MKELGIFCHRSKGQVEHENLHESCSTIEEVRHLRLLAQGGHCSFLALNVEHSLDTGKEPTKEGLLV